MFQHNEYVMHRIHDLGLIAWKNQGIQKPVILVLMDILEYMNDDLAERTVVQVEVWLILRMQPGIGQ